MIYKIKAIDQLFFRSAIPFEAAGETHLIESYFPPLPSTYTGAFRSLLPTLEPKDQARQLRISYNGLRYKNTFCFPKPLDTISIEEFSLKEKHFELEVMTFSKVSLSDFPLDYCLIPSTKSEKKLPEDLYVNQTELEYYLNGGETTITGFSLEDYLTKETKIGIEINDTTSVTENGMLYQIQMIRPKDKNDCDIELAVEVKGIDEEIKTEHIQLGGERKIVQIEKLENELKIKTPHQDSKFFKLYFATPAIFEQGWLPKWIKKIDKDKANVNPDYIGEFSYKGRKVKVRLIAATVGRYVPVGGFGYDGISTARPKEMRYAIPAGSVYFFEILEGDFTKVQKLFHQRCVSDYRERLGFDHLYFSRDRLVYCDRGFGYALVGALSEKQKEDLKCLNKKN